jgi:cell division protein FtsI (penicillin-binding protein 3)
MSRAKTRSTRVLFAEHPQLFTVLAVFFVVMVIYAAQLIDLQAVRPERYRSLAHDQGTATRTLPGFRGRLLDREGFVLAASTPTQQIIADPQLVKDPEWTAALLAPQLGRDASDLETRLLPSSPEDRYNVVATTADAAALAGIRALVADSETSKAFSGIVIRPEEDRLYPAGELARPVIGRVDPDEVGRSGIELQFDEILRGTEGVERFERGRFGSISVGERSVQLPERGFDLTLTLDHRVQFGTEAILKDTCEKLGAQGASAIVSDPSTGEVYAMASVERTGETTCGVASYNKAAIDTFEPGSVMKVVSFAAAADRLGYKADDQMMVPGSIEVSDKRFFDHPSHDDQLMRLADAMGQSSNVAAITLSQQMGKEVYYDYATGFGFGQLTGLGVKGESTGVLRSPSEWLGSDAGSIVIGQGMTVNLMQLASAFNTVGNDGLYTPLRLVAEPAENEDRRRVISPEAASETLTMLTAVTGEDGTGAKAQIEGYTVAGKTGTAWKVFDNGSGRLTYGTDQDRRYLTTFGGLVPAEAPELSVVLVIDEPRTATSATTAAAPTFAQIAQYALRVLNIAPAGGDDQPGWREQRALVRGTPALAEDGPRGQDPTDTPAPTAATSPDETNTAIETTIDADPPAVIEQPAETDPPDPAEPSSPEPNVVSLDLSEGGE